MMILKLISVECFAFMVLMSLLGITNCFGITLSNNNKTQYTIVASQSAIEAETTAANELASFLQQVTGAEFQILKENEVGGRRKRIFVGQSASVERMLPTVNWKKLGADGIVIKTIGDDIILAGGRPRGTLYAVYTFLEDIIGCHWWTRTESDIPSKRKLDIGKLDIIYTPKFYYRETLFADLYRSDSYRFAAQLKLNGHHHPLPVTYGGFLDIIGFVHTFNRLLPPDKYFKLHPEWYSLIGGQRSETTQLCLTNKEMQQEMLKNASEWINQQPGQNIISISQNDAGSGACECEVCSSIVKREGSQMGPLLHFVNQFAEELEKQYPDIIVETLSYAYTTTPPRYVKPRKNVIIRLCDISANFNQPLDSPTNIAFANELKGWSKIAPSLFIWDYVVNFGSWNIHPNQYVLGPNLRLFANNNVTGVFEQGQHSNSESDFAALKTWMIGHLMWNPYQDDKKLMSEFVNAYYGSAGPYIAKYIKCMYSAFARQNTYMTISNQDFTALRLADMNNATELFDKASAAVKDSAKYEQRVMRARLLLDYMWIRKWNDFKYEAKSGGLAFKGPEDPSKAITELQERVQQLGAGGFEADILKKYLLVPASKIPASDPDPGVGIKLNGKKWIDVQEKQFRCSFDNPKCYLDADSPASDGVAVVMPGDTNDWWIQYDMIHAGSYRYYAIVRCEVDASKPLDGVAFSCGVYNQGIQIKVPVKDVIDGKYRAYDLGLHTPYGKYLWIAPASTESIKKVIVDRIVLVKEN